MTKTGAAPTRAGTGPRVSVDDWVELGLRLLAEEGLSAIKIDRVCARISVTKGSLYWHFTDLEAYMEALAERWGEVRDAARASFRELEHLEPPERLRRMMAMLADPRQWPLEPAVREWARSDPAVAERVHKSDRWVNRAVLKAFADAGFSGADAEVRGRSLFFAGVGVLQTTSERDLARGAEERQAFLDILLAR